ncbi:MAG: response regulator [Bacteroidetes bacterium]|nr:response regulator [Bacteroidota bacterium]
MLILCLSAGDIQCFSQSSFNSETLTVEDGLSQGYVTSILQDREGFLWFGTRNGLNRYDGYQFEVFVHNPLDSFSISGNLIFSILEMEDYLVIGTLGDGLNVFDKKKQRFFRLHAKGELDKWLSTGDFYDLLTDEKGHLWCRFKIPEGKIYVAKLELGTFSTKSSWVQDFELSEAGEYHGLQMDKYHKFIWGNSNNSLFRISTATGHFNYFDAPLEGITKVRPLQDGSVLFSSTEAIGSFNEKVWKVMKTDFATRDFFVLEKELVVATKAGELLRFHLPRFEAPVLHAFEGEHIIEIEKGRIASIYHDDSGILWAGTTGYGLVKVNPRVRRFKTQFFGESILNSILVDRQGGLKFYTKDGEKGYPSNSQHTLHDFPFPLEPHTVMKIDPNGSEYVMTIWERQFKLCQKKTTGDAWEQLLSIPFNDKTGEDDYYKFSFDKEGDIWLVRPGILSKFNLSDKQLKDFSFENLSADFNKANDLEGTADGSWWVATDKGLLWAKPNAGGFDFQLLKTLDGQANGILNNNIGCLLTDPKDANLLWIGTLGGGLSRLDIRKMKFAHFTTRNGLPNNVIYTIIPDEEGRFWMSSNKGIIRFNPTTGEIKNYTVKDGLPANEFNARAYGQAPDGTLFFGCVKGIVSFRPMEILDNPYVPTVRFTGLEVNNRLVSEGDTSGILSENIEFAESIELPFSQNSLALEFAAMEFSIPSKNKFRYYLKGAEQPWVHETTEHQASYLNLSPDKYTFLVQASNSDGVWNDEPTALRITILPPWYRTTAAYFGYALLFIGLVFGMVRFVIYRQKLKHRMALEHQEAERLKELDTFKTRLYTNITHEFRTPLTVILGMTEQLELENATKKNDKSKKKLSLIHRNGRSLLNLVNQILDLSKVQNKELKVDYRQGDIVQYTRYITESFHSLANSRNIMLRVVSKPSEILMDYDPEKMLKIVSNLLSNALKYTPSGGKVTLELSQKDAVLQLIIRDTGQGIADNELPHIFDRFYQAKNSNGNIGGTGIGLALTQELVKLLGGSIGVESEVGSGTIFTIQLPITNSAVLSSEDEQFAIADTPTQSPSTPIVKQPATIEDSQLPYLLIIEDNPDVVEYLTACLEGNYQLDFAYNGRAGIEKALESVPDIIISDVMMPEKDGFEVCETLKNDERTSHIPIVLLTAKADMDSRIAGLRRGADAYLGKPFHQEELAVVLAKLVELRSKLQERYSSWNTKAPAGNSKVASAPTLEDVFLEKAKDIVSSNLSKAEFSTQDLCREMGMSYPVLHRKLAALTSRSPAIFIRSVRLQAAKEMLLTTDAPISEIAYDCGFNDPKFFSRSFSQEFGVSPTSFRKDN